MDVCHVRPAYMIGKALASSKTFATLKRSTGLQANNIIGRLRVLLAPGTFGQR